MKAGNLVIPWVAHWAGDLVAQMASNWAATKALTVVEV